MTTKSLHEQTGYADWQALYRAHYDPILKFILNFKVGKATAEDLTQNTFERVINKIDQFDPQVGQLQNCIYQIAKNLALNYKRRKNGENAYQAGVFANHLPTTKDFELPEQYVNVYRAGLTRLPEEQQNSEEIFIERELVARSLEAIADEGAKKAIKLYIFEDKSYQEISDELGIPIGTVMSRLHRAKKIMQAAVAEE